MQVTKSIVTSPGLPFGTTDSLYGRKGSEPNYSPVKGLTREQSEAYGTNGGSGVQPF